MPSIMRSLSGLALAAAAAAFVAAGCTQTAVRPAPGGDPAGNALRLEAAGDHDAAAAEYLRLAKSYPDRAAHYRLLAAEAQLAAGRRDEARASLGAAGAKNPEDRLHARIVEARLALADGQAETAIRLLRKTPDESAPSLLRARRLDVRAAAFEEQGAFAAAAADRIRRLKYGGAGGTDDLERIWADLNRAETAQLEALRGEAGPDIGSWVELALLARQLAPTPDALTRALGTWMDQYPSHPAIPAITGRILARSERAVSRPDRIALLLPLTGQYQQVAAAIRDGFLAAWYASADYQPVVRVYDTNSLNVVAQYRRAVEEGAGIVVGPLEKAAIEELVRAGGLSVPTLALNTLDAPPPVVAGATEEPVLMQFGLPPEEEARAAAQRAWFDGRARALVIGPANAWGRRLMQAFRSEWEQLGGIVLEEVSYEPALNDFSETVSALLNLDSSSQRGRALRERLGRRLEYGARLRQDADMIFMAALPVAARQILPQLRFFSADFLPVYSSSHAFSGDAGAGPDTDLDGLRFPDMPWVLSPGSEVEQAVERNWSARSSALRRLYAFGADAFLVIPHLARLSLQPGATFRGQTGELTLGADGTLRRKLPWARIVNGTPRLLDPQPGS
jgi:outer membrane PBP1 activator LpoA protein